MGNEKPEPILSDEMFCELLNERARRERKANISLQVSAVEDQRKRKRKHIFFNFIVITYFFEM